MRASAPPVGCRWSRFRRAVCQGGGRSARSSPEDAGLVLLGPGQCGRMVECGRELMSPGPGRRYPKVEAAAAPGAVAAEMSLLAEATQTTVRAVTPPGEPPRDTVHRDLERLLPAGRIDAVIRGHGLILCLHTPMINGGRVRSRTSPQARSSAAGCMLPGPAGGGHNLTRDVHDRPSARHHPHGPHEGPLVRKPCAECSPDRLFCHTSGRGRDQHLMIPGRPYSLTMPPRSRRYPGRPPRLHDPTHSPTSRHSRRHR